jgi:hypothetical protein
MKTILQHWLSRRWFSVGMSFVAALAAQASTQVTFTVDMSTETLGTPTAVYVTGSFPEAGPWSEYPASLAMINVSGTIWSNTFTLSDPAGTVEQVKFTDNVSADNGGWEPSANREFLMGTTGTIGPGTEVLPLAIWNTTSTWPTPTNWVTFQVDMTAQILLNNFTNDNSNALGDPNGSITVSGDLIGSGWDNGWPLTNNPALVGNATNVYSAAVPIPGFLGPITVNYKFRMNGGWEGVANRQASITSSSQVLPLVFYNNNSPYDLLSAPITVTFSIYMPDGTLDDGNNITAAPYPFDPESGDTLWINGDFLNNWNNTSWPGPVGNFPAAQQMIEVGSSGVYTNSFVVPKGNSIVLTYKYSIDSIDDENGFATNHVREIRSYGPTYAMPQDVWSWSVLQPNNGNPYPLAGIASTNIVEPDFGYLAAGAPSGGNIPITWLGRPAVLLQNSSSLSGGIWNNNNATDGLQSYNWPNTGGNQFFRLMKKQ